MMQRFTEAFDAIAYESWRERVEKGLAGASFERRLCTETVEGLRIEPLYSHDHAAPGAFAASVAGRSPFLRGGRALATADTGWELRVAPAHADPQRAREAIVTALARGADALELALGRMQVSSKAALSVVLEGVALDQTPITLMAGSETLAAAAAFFAIARERAIPLSALRGGLSDDPLGQLAATGCLGESLDRRYELMGELLRFVRDEVPGMRTIEVSGVPYAEGGASAAEEMALVLATMAENLRQLESVGFGPEVVAGQSVLSLGIGRDLFMELAKVRALRLCWSRLVSACGVAEAQQYAPIHLSSLDRRRTRRDPWVNLLRATMESFVVAVSGAESATIAPFDAVLGESDAFAERLARNTQLVLREESQLHRVVDPAGGSYYLETITAQLAHRAWKLFQGIEGEGGLAAAHRSGRTAREIAATAARTRAQITRRKQLVTGVSSYPLLQETRLCRSSHPEAPPPPPPAHDARLDALRFAPPGQIVGQAIAAVAAFAEFGEVQGALAEGSVPESAPPVVVEREAEPFERLRDASDRADQSPRVFLASLGSLSEHRARTLFAGQLFAAGGIEASESDGFDDLEDLVAAYKESGALLAVICSSDALYEERAVSVAARLKEAGARRIYLAGRPGKHEAMYREAGVDEFVHLGCDAEALLIRALELLGLLR